jgi:hypothetical protein
MRELGALLILLLASSARFAWDSFSAASSVVLVRLALQPLQIDLLRPAQVMHDHHALAL